MESAAQLIVQTGALGLLAYIIFWVTKSGAPSIINSMNGIQEAIERSSKRLENLEDRHEAQNKMIQRILAMAEEERKESARRGP